jgi:hypothetical protein
MASLLGQFFQKINGSQEDIASQGIVYILQSSLFARDSISNFLDNITGINFPNINYISQSVGENKERPDISGIDQNGNEVIIMEAKFWASLTENQPIEYLKRLKPNSVLLFICPSLRKTSLINEIEYRLKDSNINYSQKNNNLITDDNKYIVIIDWSIILDNLKNALLNNNEKILVSDVDQIIGFCEIIDNNSFLPIRDNDLSPSIAKRLNSYCDLLDKIVDKLKSTVNASTLGFKATPQKYGYTRYISIKKYGFSIDVNMKMWELFADTPFWITVKYQDSVPWKQPAELKNRLNEISIKLNIRIFQNTNNDLSFAIVPKINEVENIVIENFENIIMKILDELK